MNKSPKDSKFSSPRISVCISQPVASIISNFLRFEKSGKFSINLHQPMSKHSKDISSSSPPILVSFPHLLAKNAFKLFNFERSGVSMKLQRPISRNSKDSKLSSP
ncbi:hypothetical protein LguiB_013451 [Lonicera macranthoides]